MWIAIGSVLIVMAMMILTEMLGLSMARLAE